jgi:hypothetical protein
MGLSLLKRIAYEEELSKVKINEKLKKYYQENPAKKEEFLKKVFSLREKIINDEEIGDYYKKSFLSSIDRNLEYLNKTDFQILEILFPIFTFILGFATRGKIENFFQSYDKEIVQTIKEEFRNLYEQR